MSQVLITESYLGDIADAIREKNGSEDTYTPAQMADAIEDIHTADEVVLVSKSVTSNGTYNPASDSADGYSGVSVNVPNTYVAADEGKVVVNQALTDQTSKSININGTHDTTANNSVVVDVPNSYAAADEGKVVSSGELVAQTSRNITENGTYDTTENNEVVISVQGGQGGQIPSAYLTLIHSAMYTSWDRVFDAEGFYFPNVTVSESKASNHFLTPIGQTPCSAEVYFDADTLGYLLGFGSSQTRKMFSFTPGKFVGYSEDHNFQNSYLGKHHFVVTYDGNTTVKLYADGILAETFTLSGSLNIGTQYIFQGRWCATNNELLTGEIYFTRIWNRTLSASEATLLYENRMALIPTS